jgi:2-deoxy-D-gluconate 3-dehydrogenase
VGLAEAGADVAVLDRQAPHETCRQVAALGRQSHALELDLEHITAETARTVIEECISLWGRFDILINNAGIIRRAAALEFTQEDWEAVLNINLSRTFYLCQAAARHFVGANQVGKNY